jgi:hypothetical protein
MWNLWRTKRHWDRFLSEFLVLPCQHYSTAYFHTLTGLSSAGWTIGPLVAAVQRHSLNPSTLTTYIHSSFYENSHYDISFKRTFVVKSIPSAWYVIRKRPAYLKYSEQNRTRVNKNVTAVTSPIQSINRQEERLTLSFTVHLMKYFLFLNILWFILLLVLRFRQ